MKSPLRYPGGKSRAVKHIIPYFPKDTQVLISPFFGGGSIELYLADSGMVVKGYDDFSPLVKFWQTILNIPEMLADNVQKYLPLSKEKFYEIQSNLRNKEEKMSSFQVATIFYVLNRSSFCGTTLSGGMGPDHPRFTQSSIERVREFRCPNLSVDCLSFEESLNQKMGSKTSIYLDPPYLLKNSNLYGDKGSKHKKFDHEMLHEVIKNKRRWVMSYNDCEPIRKLYSNFRIEESAWSYGMNNSKESSEILIFSNDLEKIDVK